MLQKCLLMLLYLLEVHFLPEIWNIFVTLEFPRCCCVDYDTDRTHAIAQVKLQLSRRVAWGSSDCTHHAFPCNYLVMIIPLNYLAIIISIGELMQNSHCAARVIPTALCSLSVFLLTDQNPFAPTKSTSMLI